jgi:hypothetical protein
MASKKLRRAGVSQELCELLNRHHVESCKVNKPQATCEIHEKTNKKYIFLHIYNGKTLKGWPSCTQKEMLTNKKIKNTHQAHIFRINKRQSFRM